MQSRFVAVASTAMRTAWFTPNIKRNLFFMSNRLYRSVSFTPKTYTQPTQTNIRPSYIRLLSTTFRNQNAYPTNAAVESGFSPVLERKDTIKTPRLLSTKVVGWWLLISAAAVFGIVVIGGLTRLTESGLSITEWRPVTGSILPMGDIEWNREFDKYKESPEFKQLNSNLTLDEFKFIYFMEWFHRLWGRAIGFLIVLPAVYFIARRRTDPATNRALLLATALIGFQGFLGWWMVKSGLDQDHLNSRDNSQPRVSQYRLAAHLCAAFLLYMVMTAKGLDILRSHRLIKEPVKALKNISLLNSPLVTPFRRYTKGLLVLAFLTSMSGAFVAGLDAGMIYNQFPMMGERLIPSTNELFDTGLLKRQGLELNSWTLFWKNMLENPVTVQLTHRTLAIATWTLTLGLFIYARRMRPFLPRNVYMGAHGAFGFATLQAALGISTLILVVPVSLASAHQAGSLAFLTMMMILLNRLRLPRRQIKQLLELMANKAKAPAAPMGAHATKRIQI